jgi:hypothetical protein
VPTVVSAARRGGGGGPDRVELITQLVREAVLSTLVEEWRERLEPETFELTRLETQWTGGEYGCEVSWSAVCRVGDGIRRMHGRGQVRESTTHYMLDQRDPMLVIQFVLTDLRAEPVIEPTPAFLEGMRAALAPVGAALDHIAAGFRTWTATAPVWVDETAWSQALCTTPPPVLTPAERVAETERREAQRREQDRLYADRRAAERERQRRIRAETDRLLAERDAAEDRARELLRSLLTAEQRRDLDQDQRIRLVGSHGTRWEIDVTHFDGNVRWYERDGSLGGRFCAHPSGHDYTSEPGTHAALPASDIVAGQLLLLQTNEVEFMATANHYEGNRPPYPVDTTGHRGGSRRILGG